MKLSNLKNVSALSLTALIWGTSFVCQAIGNNFMQPFTFSAVRNLLGCLVLIPVIFIMRVISSKNKDYVKPSTKTTVIGGILCGIVLTIASMFQQYGVKYTTVGKSGFITALYMIIIPLLGLFLGKKCRWTVWVSVIAAIIGLYMLCLTESFSLALGDILTFICAVFFAVHILVIDYFAPKTDNVMMSCIQFFVCFFISMVISLAIDNPTWEQITDGWFPLLYSGILSSGVAYTLQIVGQKNFNPTVAAIILSLESVISAVSGYFAYKCGFLNTDQSLTVVQITGCVIVFAAVIFVQLPIPSRKSLRKVD